MAHIRPRDARELPAVFTGAPCRHPANIKAFVNADRRQKKVGMLTSLCRACPALDACDVLRQNELKAGRDVPAGLWAGRLGRSAKTLEAFKAGA